MADALGGLSIGLIGPLGDPAPTTLIIGEAGLLNYGYI